MSTDTKTVDLVITRVFDASVEQVWKAWSEAEQIKRWWGPVGFTAPIAEIDFREGGTSLVCMSSPEHGTNYSTWHYQKIVPLQRIEFIHNLADKDGNKVDPTAIGMPPDFPVDQLQAILFKTVSPGKTELIVTEFGWTEGQMMEFSRMGMEQCLDKLAESLKS